MNDLKTVIQEKLKVNSNTKLLKNYYNRDAENWTIKDAKDGDFVVWVPDNKYFIYKCLNGEIKLDIGNKFVTDAIVYHVLYDPKHDKLIIGPKTGIGDISYEKWYKFASDEECEILLKGLDKHGYKWDEKQLKVIEKQ